MKSNTTISNMLKFDDAVTALPEVIVDWNLNRYYQRVASNPPEATDGGFDEEIFPIESIVENNRPNKGINKARINHSIIGRDYLYEGNNTRNGRYYIADPDDYYKYWTSPGKSDASGNISGVKPQVIYSSLLKTNKIVIKTENSWASAKTFQIQVSNTLNTPEASWVTVADQTISDAWKASGRIELYYAGTGSNIATWNTGPRQTQSGPAPATCSLYGVRIVVTSLEGGYKSTVNGALVPSDYRTRTASGEYTTTLNDGKNTFFDLIEISLHLEVDLSKYVISTGSNFDLGNSSNLLPIGTTTSNQANMELSNVYEVNGESVLGLFNNENTNSPYFNLIDANAEVIISYKYYDQAGTFVGKVQESKMYVDNWTNQDSYSVQVDMTDYSKFFEANEVKVPAAMWEGLTGNQLVWRILDSVGFSDYQIKIDSDYVTDHVIPIFYTDGEATVWEIISQIAEACQMAVYFDSFGILQVKTRDFALSPTDTPVWDFVANKSGTRLPDIETLEGSIDFEPNHYSITYQDVKWAPSNRGQPTLQQVWTPETDAVTLRATPLVRKMELANNQLWIAPNEVTSWPYKGMVNVEGELMRFEGKVFAYYTGATGQTKNTTILKSQDDFNGRNAKTPLNYRHKNYFTGALVITERGVWNSNPAPHYIEATGYSMHQLVSGTYKANIGGFFHDKQHSRVQLISNYRAQNDFKCATRGAPDDLPFYNYGTRFRFLKDSSKASQRGGIVIHNGGTNENGYYFEFTPTSKIVGKTGQSEITLYSRVAGKKTIIATADAAIVENIDYEIDISWKGDSGSHRLNLWLNGKNVLSKVVSDSSSVAPSNGRFGMFAKGSTRIEFEYLYALQREEESPMVEDFSFLDKVETGYRGGQWDREWVYQMRKYNRRVKKKTIKATRRFNRQFFDEFGPIVHELREFDVKFEPSPVQHSRLYLTNDWSAICTEYYSTPFGAKFVLANTSRRNAVINGEDTLSFSGTGDSINQVLTVLGRAMVVEEGEEIVAQNDDQIKRRGKIEAEIDNTWVQSKAMAQSLVDWMNAHFSYGNEQMSLTIFGNPLIELGDVVHVTYADKFVNGDYFVMGIQNNFETGLSTTLSLRKRIS